MSWTVNLVGTPDKVVQALNETSTNLQGGSKAEFDNALPAMTALVQLNYGDGVQIVKLNAAGHAYTGYGQCTITLDRVTNILQ